MKTPWPSRDECLEAIREGDGRGVAVAILDTGIAADHPDFTGLDLTSSWSPGEHGYSESEASDTAGHGTAVAGIVHRLAPQARLISIAALEVNQRQRRHQSILQGAHLAIEQGADILNCSFGVPGTQFTLPLYKSWTDAAFHRGKLVISASSNDDVEAPEWPAHFASVIGVTAAPVQPGELRSRSGQPIPIEAAGFEIEVPTPGGGHTRLSGSSFAAAHVSALTARLLSVFPGLSPALVREALLQHAQPQR